MVECKFIKGKWEDLIKDIKDESIGLVYTDPPYGMNYVSNIPGDIRWNALGQSDAKFSKPLLNDNHGDINFSDFARQMYRVMMPDSYLVLHCNTIWIGKNIECFTDANFTYKGTIAWNKRFAIGGDIKGSMKRDWEPILYLAKGKPVMQAVNVERIVKGKIETVKRDRISEIADWTFQLSQTEKIGFPTQKPEKLCFQIISLMSKEGAILDPFAGSGTIGIVAKFLNKNSISFEADEEIFTKFLVTPREPKNLA
jgi:adenine-specific DNA-methyltransferase